ncbi:lipid A deacylase LpxR family protein [Phragmitibacter flavus]|uniref:Lipid A deacylase LpxR family protein n=1 Tax=Phragmitibacter flavus TaxID=2576071 RepID=A0A5R8K7J9_9BACT|nr:lipid A deacylase LpxR family protein [Phragmitibacter flavus]TLD68331.1 lipid A deacylase LpxR family protein [Phragmitibacter flavus]
MKLQLAALLLSLGLVNLASGQNTAPAPAASQEPVETSVPRFGVISFYFENDLFADTDQQYTNGARITITSPKLDSFADDANVGRFVGGFDEIPWIGEPGYERNVAISLGQNMYTPSDTVSEDLVRDDRPYAGWLYGGIGLVWKNEKVRNTFIINIGVVGPWSFAEETQRLVHEARDIPMPNGWNNQLDNELGVVLAYERMWRLRKFDQGGIDWDVLPYAGAELGNVAINARVGAEFRLGYNLPDDFGTAAINAAAVASTPVESDHTAKRWHSNMGFHLFTRIEGRAVARDIFLDGNTFEDSHSVDKEHFVADAVFGASLNWRNTKLTYAYIYRTKEFKQQEDEQVFGSMTLTVNF